jgi:nicotinate-nucleotide adenylyltransferase
VERRRLARVGILGGTFDPPHIGHLLLGETARQQLELDLVLLMPVGEPPHKAGSDVTPLGHRLAMTEIACANNDNLAVDCTDCDRPPPHHTVTLLPIVQAAYPAAQLWLLMGGDSLQDFPTWHNPREITAACRLAVLARPGVTIDWDWLATAVPDIRERVDWLDGPSFTLSSSDIRRWLANGRSMRYMLPSAVLRYIEKEGLYRR